MKNIKYIIILVIILILTISTIIFIHNYVFKSTYILNESSTYLKTLEINNHKIKFNKEITTYEILLENSETSLSINAVAEDKSAIIKIVNNDDLTKHSEVYIYVTSKDHSVRKYTIKCNFKTTTNYFKNNIENCSEYKSNYCIKYITLDNKNNYLLFTYDSLNNNGYPNTNIITFNDKIIFNKKLNNAEFRNFNIVDNNIIFTYNNINERNKIYLFGINNNGDTILNKTIINQKLNDLYTYYFNYDKNIITLKTRITNLTHSNICKLDNNKIMEARYTIKYQNNKFKEPVMTSSLTIQEYKLLMNIKCN